MAMLPVVCSVISIAPNAFAGVQVDNYVIIRKESDSSGSVTGGMSSVRNSADTNQYIGCQVAALSRMLKKSGQMIDSEAVSG
jgi:hypothetical protein